jgi:hypothetical protein
MSFQFDNEFNQDSYTNLVSLIKKNDGAWRSAKQRKFMQEVGLKRADPCYPRDHQNASEYFGVQLTEGQSGLVLDGHVRWAEYGRKSFRRVSWFFVLDTVGVVAKYKIHFTVTADGGFSQLHTEIFGCILMITRITRIGALETNLLHEFPLLSRPPCTVILFDQRHQIGIAVLVEFIVKLE